MAGYLPEHQKLRKLFVNPWFLLSLRFFLGLTFLVSAISKLLNQADFITSVMGYNLLPNGLAIFYGSVLPWIELVVGILLTFGWLIKVASAFSLAMVVSFIVANIQAMIAAQVNQNCGCFGNLINIGHNASLVLDIVMLFASLHLLLTTKLSGAKPHERKPPILNLGRSIFHSASRVVPIILAIIIAIPPTLFPPGGPAVQASVSQIPGPHNNWVHAQINDALDSGKSALLYFYREGCHYCEGQSPIIDEIEQDYVKEIEFTRIEANDENQAVKEFGVDSVPSTFLISGKDEGGKYLFQTFKGLTSEDILRQALDVVVGNGTGNHYISADIVNPWDTPSGQSCFGKWINESMTLLNAFNGDAEFNARKPWSINLYGVTEGNPQIGPTSAYAPDDFAQHNNNKYWWMWDHYPETVQWTDANWRGAGVPLLRSYVTTCVNASTGVSTTPPSSSAGLMGYWKLDEGSGSTALDSSGLGNNGTIKGTPSWITWDASGTSGNITGAALKFDGTTNYVLTPVQFSQLSNGMTWMAWARHDDKSMTWSWVFSEDSNDDIHSQIGKMPGTGEVRFELKGVGTLDTSGVNIADGKSHHIAGVWEKGVGLKIYIDGVQKASGTFTGSLIATKAIRIGAKNDGWSAEKWKGLISNAAIFNRALAPPEIQSAMNGGIATNPTSTAGPTPTAGSTLTLPVTIRDFLGIGSTPVAGYSIHQDFENGAGDDRGIVQKTLGTDKKPVYSGQTGHPTTHGQAVFDQWFRDAPGVNMKKDTTLTLNWDGSKYVYASGDFFPIDGQLLGNYLTSGHNFHFTLEMHTRFTYQGGETYNFTGDDDVWVYINNQQVIDLGGTHPPESASVALDTLGLSRGSVYDLDLYYAERHTSGSSIRIETTVGMTAAPPTTPVTPPPTTSTGPNAGLVAYYPFDGDYKDYSGNGNHGTAKGSMSFATGVINQGANFDGKSWIEVNDSPSLDLSTAFTFSAWLNKTDAGAGGWSVVLCKGDTSALDNSAPYAFDHTPDGIYPSVRMTKDNSYTNVDSAVRVDFQKWNLVSATWDGQNVKFYINGVLKDTKTWQGTLPSSAAKLLIGSDPAGVTEYFKGVIDDLRIYNRALSGDEIATLNSGASAPPVISTPTPSPTPSTSGTATVSLSWVDFGQDKVDRYVSKPNTISDGHFQVNLTVNGSKSVQRITLYTSDSSGNPVDIYVWNSGPSSNWILGVFRNGTNINPTYTLLNDPVSGQVSYDVYGDDAGNFKSGQFFGITVFFTDGSSVKAVTSIPSSGTTTTPTPTSTAPPSTPPPTGTGGIPGTTTSLPPFGDPQPNANVQRMSIQAAQRRAPAGELVQVPVWLILANNVANINFELTFNAAFAKPEINLSSNPPQIISKGNLIDNSLFSANSNDSGIIRAGFAGTGGVSGTGTVMNIPFRLVGKPGDRTLINITVTTLNDPTGKVLTIDRIPGEIIILNPDGTIPGTGTSTTTGIPPGDCNGDGYLTFDDATCALEMSVKIKPTRLILDLDKSGDVTSRDATIIAQRVVGKP